MHSLSVIIFTIHSNGLPAIRAKCNIKRNEWPFECWTLWSTENSNWIFIFNVIHSIVNNSGLVNIWWKHTIHTKKKFHQWFCLVWSKFNHKSFFLFDFVFVNIENSIKPTPTGCCYVNKTQLKNKNIYSKTFDSGWRRKNRSCFSIERVCSFVGSLATQTNK